jgi:hypothetical protein
MLKQLAVGSSDLTFVFMVMAGETTSCMFAPSAAYVHVCMYIMYTYVQHTMYAAQMLTGMQHVLQCTAQTVTVELLYPMLGYAYPCWHMPATAAAVLNCS